MRSCGRVIFEYNNTPCNCVTSETISGLYINGGANFPSNAANNSLHFVKYDDNVVVYKKTNTGWIEVQNYPYSGGTTDTDTRIEFNQVLPSGEWEWNIRNVIANTVLSTFTTPAIVDETITTLTGTQATGKTIGTYTNEAAAVVDIKETITSFASITNGYQFTSEDGTVYPFTFTFDNSTPSAPQLLINYGATTVSTIPLNSYDVNITTSGGFTFNPTTDQITITETDGETHVIDLTPLRTTVTASSSNVDIVQTVNPDGSNNYEIGVKDIHSVNILGTGVYDGGNPLSGWVQPTSAVQGDTAKVYFTDGIIVNFTFNDPLWEEDFPINIANRPWGTATIPTPKTADSVNIVDDIHHTGKANIGGVLTHQTFYDAQIDNGLRVHGPTRNTYDNYAINSVTLQVNPITGNDNLEPREYVDNSGVFQTLNAAINYLNNSSFTGLNTIVLTGTTALAPAILAAGSLFRGKQTNINANGQFISINGTFNNYGQIALNWGTYTFTGNFLWRNFYNSGFYAWTPTFNLSATNTTVHFLFRVGASGVFDCTTINYAGNNTSFAAMETSTSVNLFTTNFQTNGFTGCKLAKEPFNTYANANTFNINSGAWINISAQALDVTHCTIIYDNRYYHGFVTLPTLASITDQNLNVYAGNLKIYDVLKFDNNAAATVDVGVVWATSATNTVSLPEGVLMVKY